MLKLRSPGGILGLLQTILNATLSGNKTYDQRRDKPTRPTYNSSRWSNQSDSEQNASKMIKCAKCELYIPENEAISAKGKYYCCHAHANTNSNSQ